MEQAYAKVAAKIIDIVGTGNYYIDFELESEGRLLMEVGKKHFLQLEKGEQGILLFETNPRAVLPLQNLFFRDFVRLEWE